MAKPRIFLSSTCYDLSDARAALTTFLEGFGFEVLNSQKGSFGVAPKVHSHDACLEMMQNADYVVLIIGGRRGGTYVSSEQSITNEEIKAAQKLERPIIAFIDKRVDALRPMFRKNPGANFEPAVDDVRIFDFIDWVASGHEDNWLHAFDDVADIVATLRAQFAYFLLRYSQSFRKKAPAEAKQGGIVGFPAKLDGVPGDTEEEQTLSRAGLRQVYDTLKRILAADIKDGFKAEQMKSIWVVALHGHADELRLKIDESRFKGSAWGITRGRRVFAQMTGVGIRGEYDFDEDNEGVGYQTVEIVFEGKKNAENCPAEALQSWVKDLANRYGAEEGLDMFKRLDMRLYQEAPTLKPKVKLNKAASEK